MLRTISLRYLARHPALLVLALVGVAIGVAVVVAIDVANASALRAFGRAADLVAGRATHALVGGAGTVPDTVYTRLRIGGFQNVAPVIDGVATVRGQVVQVLGLDPLADAPFRDVVGGGQSGSGGGPDLSQFVATPGTVFLTEGGAARLGATVGDTLGVSAGGVRHELRLAALLRPPDEQAKALEGFAVMDIATAQTVLAMPGRLSRVDVLAPDTAALAPIRALLPRGVRAERAATRGQTLETMTRAFRLNLAALSLLALVVGMFLVYNTSTFSVVQRRPLLGRLRALGVTSTEVFAMVLGEAAVVGALGTAFGLALGVLLGRGLVGVVGQTITDLYFAVAVQQVAVPAGTLVKGTILGIGTTVLAALLPAREAAKTDVVAVLRRSEVEASARASLPRQTLLGVALALVGAALLVVPTASLPVAYVGLLAVMIGFALVVPLVVAAFAALVRRPVGAAFGTIGRMAAGSLRAHLGRLSVAVAALVVAIAATIGVGVMVASFRSTVETWLTSALQADVYVQPPAASARRSDATLDPAFAAAVQRLPGASDVYTVRVRSSESQFGPTDVLAISGGSAQEQGFSLKTGDAATVWPALRRGEGVLISEPFAMRHGVRDGDTLRLETDRGQRAFAVLATFYDYGSDLGYVLLPRGLYEQMYDDRGVSGLGLVAAPGTSPEALAAAVRAEAGQRGEGAVVRSNRALRAYSLAVFDRTFVITGVLRLLALVVAFVGVVSAFMALTLERAREYATLRAVGMTPRELFGLVGLETGLMGLVAGLLAVPLGLVLAAVLIFVVNRRSFGWTLQVDIPAEALVTAVVLAVFAALVAGLYPAWTIVRTPPAAAMRDT